MATTNRVDRDRNLPTVVNGESSWHKLLKRDAKGWLATLGDVYVKEEVAFDSNGAFLYYNEDKRLIDLLIHKKCPRPFLIVDVVAFRDGTPIAGVECGSIHNLIRRKLLKFPIYHLASFFCKPHLFGECSFCMTSNKWRINKDKNSPKLIDIKEEN